jgi:virulence plasmid B protein
MDQGERSAVPAMGRRTSATPDSTFLIRPPSVALPKGGGAIRSIGDEFSSNTVTGEGTMTVPVFTSPGRSNFGPRLELTYHSAAGNGTWLSNCGLSSFEWIVLTILCSIGESSVSGTTRLWRQCCSWASRSVFAPVGGPMTVVWRQR